MQKYNPACSIGVFDSGLGGLSTVAELRRIMPCENIVYFGDTGRVPYGTKSHDTIQKYAKQDMRFLLSQNVKAVICACNTAATVISEDMISGLDVPFFEVLNPAVVSAAKKTKSGKIGVICTLATARSHAYEKSLHNINKDYEVITKACPLFVPLVENGYTNSDNEVTRLVAKQYLEVLLNANVDTLIMGCTHYPIIKEIIANIMGENVTLIDSGAEVASVVYDFLGENKLLNLSNQKAVCNYFVSDDPTDFKNNAGIILNDRTIENAVKINIEGM